MQPMWHRRGLLFGLSAIAAILLLATASRAYGLTAAQPGSVHFSLSPPSATVATGDVVVLTIRFDATSQPVSVAQAYLNFDPAFLQVVDESGNPAIAIEPGTVFAPPPDGPGPAGSTGTWTDLLQNSVDNAAGTIDFAGGKGTTTGEDASGGIFELATIRFKAVAPSTGTPVTFNNAVPRQTMAVSGTVDVTGTLDGAAITINGPEENQVDVTFTMSLQGRGSSGPQWQLPFVVRLYAPGTTNLVASFTPTTEPATGSSSAFVLTLAPGTYDIWAKGENTLAQLLPGQPLTDGSTVPLGVQVGGDATRDNAVNSSDYDALLPLFGTVPSIAIDNLHDHNRDGVIDAMDYAIVVENFEDSGAPEPTS